MNRPRIAENFSPEAVINQRFQATRWNLIFFSFLLAHCGRMSERSKESPAEIAGGYLSIYVYAYILGMTRNAARLIENINDFSRFFPRTNDTYASGYWYVVQDTWQLDVSAKNVWKPLSCARVCDTTIARSIRAVSLRSDLEPHPRSWIFRGKDLPSAPHAPTSEWKYSPCTTFSFRHFVQAQLVSPSC